MKASHTPYGFNVYMSASEAKPFGLCGYAKLDFAPARSRTKFFIRLTPITKEKAQRTHIYGKGHVAKVSALQGGGRWAQFSPVVPAWVPLFAKSKDQGLINDTLGGGYEWMPMDFSKVEPYAERAPHRLKEKRRKQMPSAFMDPDDVLDPDKEPMAKKVKAWKLPPKAPQKNGSFGEVRDAIRTINDFLLDNTEVAVTINQRGLVEIRIGG